MYNCFEEKCIIFLKIENTHWSFWELKRGKKQRKKKVKTEKWWIDGWEELICWKSEQIQNSKPFPTHSWNKKSLLLLLRIPFFVSLYAQLLHIIVEMEAIRKQATKLREQVARQQQVHNKPVPVKALIFKF